jgi:hypothetical protein
MSSWIEQILRHHIHHTKENFMKGKSLSVVSPPDDDPPNETTAKPSAVARIDDSHDMSIIVNGSATSNSETPSKVVQVAQNIDELSWKLLQFFNKVGQKT